MLVQARGTLIAVRLVPTSLFLLQPPSSLSAPPRTSASRRVLLSPFSLLSPSRERKRLSEYRSGLSYACGVSRLAKGYTRTHVRARNGLTYVRGGAPSLPLLRSAGRLAGRSVAEKVYTKATSLLSLCVRECRFNARTSLAAYIHRFGWCMDQS